MSERSPSPGPTRTVDSTGVVSVVPAGVGYEVDADRRRRVISESPAHVVRCFAEIWAARELLFMLVVRDIKVRYRATTLGILWAFITPLLTIIIYSLFFGVLGRMGTEGVPYPVFLFAALLIWGYFDSSVSRASNALISSGALVSRVYFPRQVLPVANVISPLVDLFFGLLILLAMLLIYRIVPGTAILLLPAYFLLAMAGAIGVGLAASVLNGLYRDVRHFMPVLMRLWFFSSPIIYPVELVPEAWRPLYAVNPMVTVCGGFRSALLGTPPPTVVMIGISTAVTAALLVGGVLIFRSHEETVTDFI
ncbi:MAG: ABC transporter permease [Planctomycetes bacterium]|nr:ABC transporter permease [Planctomycetota bacterium]